MYVLPGDRGDGPKVQTDGVNFESVWAHDDIIDVNGITTNDIAAVLRTYGVEVGYPLHTHTHTDTCTEFCTQLTSPCTHVH